MKANHHLQALMVRDLGRVLRLVLPGAVPSLLRASSMTTRCSSAGIVNELSSTACPPIARSGQIIHHGSSRRPRKNGCRTFPLGRLRSISISANNFGSTQTPLCAIRFVYGCVFRISGCSLF